MILTVDMADAFDTLGRQYGMVKSWVQIGHVRTLRREVIEGVKTPVWFPNEGPDDDKTLRTMARLRFWFNGKELVFRRVRMQEWSAWEEIMKSLGEDEDAPLVALFGGPAKGRMGIAIQ